MKPMPMQALAEAVLLLKMKSDMDTPQIYKVSTILIGHIKRKNINFWDL